MLITLDTPYMHGITIFNNKAIPIGRVQSFDTDTNLCRLDTDEVVEAAGYAIIASSEYVMHKHSKMLPALVLQHVFQEVFDGTEEQLDRIKEFCCAQCTVEP